MHTLDIKRFAFALASVVTLLYAGCVLVMATVPKDAAIRFFNSLLHGVDVASIARWDMPFGEMIIGLLETFILGWLFGAAFAFIYNVGAGTRSSNAR